MISSFKQDAKYQNTICKMKMESRFKLRPFFIYLCFKSVIKVWEASCLSFYTRGQIRWKNDSKNSLVVLAYILASKCPTDYTTSKTDSSITIMSFANYCTMGSYEPELGSICSHFSMMRVVGKAQKMCACSTINLRFLEITSGMKMSCFKSHYLGLAPLLNKQKDQNSHSLD